MLFLVLLARLCPGTTTVCRLRHAPLHQLCHKASDTPHYCRTLLPTQRVLIPISTSNPGPPGRGNPFPLAMGPYRLASRHPRMPASVWPLPPPHLAFPTLTRLRLR